MKLPVASRPLKNVKSRHQVMLDAEADGNRLLAEANEAAERGDKQKAERLYERGQIMLDIYNKLAGNP